MPNFEIKPDVRSASYLGGECPSCGRERLLLYVDNNTSTTSNHFTHQPKENQVSTAVITNGEILSRHKITTEGIEHLDLKVPILNGPQAQGDIMIVPVFAREGHGETVPASGVTIVRGETEAGNAHILHALDGECFWAPSPDAATELLQGWLTIPEGSSATVVHTQEHNVIGVAPGCYEIRRQREFAGEWRRVSD